MEAIGTLAGGIAHDFNNILFPILAYTEMSMEMVPKDSETHNNLEAIYEASNRAKELVQQILTFIRQSDQKKGPLYVQTKTAERASILIVDDDEDIRKHAALILKNNGYKVSTSKDGIDALISIAKRHFDLILSDVNMPNLDGFKLLELINQKGIKTPVIFLTSRDSIEDEKKGLELGAIDYIKKPIQKEILALRVNSVLQNPKK